MLFDIMEVRRTAASCVPRACVCACSVGSGWWWVVLLRGVDTCAPLDRPYTPLWAACVVLRVQDTLAQASKQLSGEGIANSTKRVDVTSAADVKRVVDAVVRVCVCVCVCPLHWWCACHAPAAWAHCGVCLACGGFSLTRVLMRG